jgi:hypothetical protein
MFQTLIHNSNLIVISHKRLKNPPHHLVEFNKKMGVIQGLKINLQTTSFMIVELCILVLEAKIDNVWIWSLQATLTYTMHTKEHNT